MKGYIADSILIATLEAVLVPCIGNRYPVAAFPLLKIPDSPNARRCKDTGEYTCGRQQAAEAAAYFGLLGGRVGRSLYKSLITPNHTLYCESPLNGDVGFPIGNGGLLS
jgi:hypothetical protein